MSAVESLHKESFDSIGHGLLIGQLKAIPWNLG